MIKWVATAITTDDDGSHRTFHVEGSKADIDYLLESVPQAGWVVEKKAATWECDGRDNCRVEA